MASPDVYPVALTCPIRGLLKPRKKPNKDLSALEERHRIDAIRHLLSLGYAPSQFKIEAVVARFGSGGKNSFRCDFAVLDCDAADLSIKSEDDVSELLAHALILAEIKRDDSGDEKKAKVVLRTQVEPLLNFAPRKDTVGLYWDGAGQRVFWKEDVGRAVQIRSGPLALMPRPGRTIKAKPLSYSDLLPPPSLDDVFSRIENILHADNLALDKRYNVLLQLIIAKIYDEHQGEANPKGTVRFQDFQSLGVSVPATAKELNAVLVEANAFYSAHLPSPIEDRFGVDPDTLARCGQMLAPHKITAASKEVIQKFYMKFAKNLYKWDLAQYFTPPTVTDFIVDVLNPSAGELIKDPACGSADFLVATFHRSRALGIKNAADMIYGADNDANAVQVAVVNMVLNGDGKTNIRKDDSLLSVADDREKASTDKRYRPQLHHVLVCNPPFGVKIVEKRPHVLKQFDLGHAWQKAPSTGRWEMTPEVRTSREKGILFAEVCVRQTRPGGRIGIILPNGYLGNRSDSYVSFREWLLRHCKIIALCGFPRYTFKSSGADVSASVLFLEKRSEPLADSAHDTDYMVSVELIENVGWEVSNKKSKPIYLRADTDGSFITDEVGNKVVRSDFQSTLSSIRSSPAAAKVSWMANAYPESRGKPRRPGWAVPIENVVADPLRTLDPKRHSRKYAAVLADLKAVPHKLLMEVCELIPQSRTSTGKRIKKQSGEVYQYVDIDAMGNGDFTSTSYRGWELSDRAKHFAEPGDIFVGGIWSSVSKWCLVPNVPLANLVVTNGCHRLRIKPGQERYVLDLCVAFSSLSYTTQMRALARGSDGMAQVHEDDLAHVIIPLVADDQARTQCAPLVERLVNGMSTLQDVVRSLRSSGVLSTPEPVHRPHHSSLV